MKDENIIKKLIREELTQILKENRTIYQPHVSVKNGIPLTSENYTSKYNIFYFQPKRGDKIYFDIPTINFNSGTIIGFGVGEKVGTIFIELDSSEEEYIELNINNQQAIKKIEILDKGWTLIPGLKKV